MSTFLGLLRNFNVNDAGVETTISKVCNQCFVNTETAVEVYIIRHTSRKNKESMDFVYSSMIIRYLKKYLKQFYSCLFCF